MKLKDAKLLIAWSPRSGGTFVWQVLVRIFKIGVASRHRFEKTDLPVVMVYRDFRDVVASHWRIRFGKYDSKGVLINKHTECEIKRAIQIVKSNLFTLRQYKTYYEKRKNVLWLRYEDFFNNYDYLFKEFENFFKIKISKELREKIKEETNREINIKIGNQLEHKKGTAEFDNWDRSSKIHKRHVYTKKIGEWEDIVPKKYHTLLNDGLKEELKEWGYSL
ncbi:MAG: sulfotransferase domain-containing protein [Promethearchaeota archaeon]